MDITIMKLDIKPENIEFIEKGLRYFNVITPFPENKNMTYLIVA